MIVSAQGQCYDPSIMLAETTAQHLLEPLALKYIWWEPPSEALRFPQRVIAQVMDLGTHEDSLVLTDLVGEDALGHSEKLKIRSASRLMHSTS